jgi:hypothetical protein
LLEQGVLAKPLAPVDEVAIKGTGGAAHLHVAANGGSFVLGQERASWRAEAPMIVPNRQPVGAMKPCAAFVWMTAPCPTPEELEKRVVAGVKGLRCDDGAGIVAQPVMMGLSASISSLWVAARCARTMRLTSS